MRQESGGQEDVISWAGAMGLMQVMPDTYDGLRARYNLGDDPFNPHNNILAGTAYLREMYDRFGSPGFLAAYNAGPNRMDQYLSNGAPLPTETVNYVASVAPLLGSDSPMSGPLAVYAQGATVTRVAYRPTSAGCDPDAAYDPGRPCTPLRPVQTVEATPYAVAPHAVHFGGLRPRRCIRPDTTVPATREGLRQCAADRAPGGTALDTAPPRRADHNRAAAAAVCHRGPADPGEDGPASRLLSSILSRTLDDPGRSLRHPLDC